MSLAAAQYLEHVDAAALFRQLKVPNPDALARNVAHFTEREAAERDAIVLGYLGEDGARQVTEAIVEALLAAGAMNPAPALLDIGAGSGFFTARVEEALRARGLRPRMFAMDATPAMLRVLGAKGVRAVPFLGAFEDLEGSVREARKLQPLPELFDGAFSTLALHHCSDPALLLAGAARVLRFGAPLALVDLVEHDLERFRAMGDLHLGFPPERIAALALEHFHTARVEALPGCRCTGDGGSVQLFLADLRR
ncbi:MAG TPA: methyltransferase domain-containing protein [Candidatus Thermoplasmatota archaeon]|jgi:SAM-dependent methyltransferase|nr:methyltransferase domain-containing protein [Candidatus Thermoplasmatota archaeon]